MASRFHRNDYEVGKGCVHPDLGVIEACFWRADSKGGSAFETVVAGMGEQALNEALLACSYSGELLWHDVDIRGRWKMDY